MKSTVFEMNSSGFAVMDNFITKEGPVDMHSSDFGDMKTADLNMNTNAVKKRLVGTYISDPGDVKECIMKTTNTRNVPLKRTMEEISNSENFYSESSKQEDCIQNSIKSEEIEIKTVESDDDSEDVSFEEEPMKLNKHQGGKNAEFKCHECQKVYKRKETLFYHIKTKHSQFEKYQCNYCLQRFLRKDYLKRHISSIHLKLRPYICKGCKETFSRKDFLHSHIVSNHQENLDLMKTVTYKIYNCDHCTFKCLRDNVMKNHLTTHGIRLPCQKIYNKKYQCNYCLQGFLRKGNFKRHISSIHLKLRSYICKGCKETFSGKYFLHRHIASNHQENLDLMKMVKILNCDHCTFKCFRNDVMKNHQKIHGILLSCHKCAQCQKNFSRKQNLFDHINTKHLQVEEYQCNYCLRGFLRKDCLKRHILSIHLKIRPYICKDCKKTFSHKNLLDRHIVSHHQNNLDLMKMVKGKIHNCDHCTFKCLRNDIMKNHQKTHGIRLSCHTEFKCPHCQKIFSRKQNLFYHINTKHSPLEKYQCNYCLQGFLRKDYLRRHISLIHLKLRPYICKGCKETFSRKYFLHRHIVSNHQENLDLMKMVKFHNCDHCTFKCLRNDVMKNHKKTHGIRMSCHTEFKYPQCQNIFSKTQSLFDHINTKHSQGNEYQCSYCLQGFLRKDCLKRHISSIHLKIRPYSCKDCKKTFSDKNVLDRHIVSLHQKNLDLMKLVTGKIHNCDHCAFKSTRNDVMKKHQKTHGIRLSCDAEFKCPHCQKNFSRKQTLFDHINTKHSQVEKYQCNYCLQVFSRKAYLKKHISSIHLKLRSYVCNDCNKTFNSKYSLNRHIISYHQENCDLMKTVTSKIYNCDHCTFKSLQTNNMNRHIKTHGRHI